MAKLGLLSLFTAFVATIAAVGLTSQEASAAKPCARTKFETTLVADACKKGGQEEAKTAMKAYLKEAKKKNSGATCKTCHSKLAPKYELKKDGLKLFKEYGGK